MKVHENLARLMVIGGLSLSVAVAQTTGTSGTTNPTSPAGQTGSTSDQRTGTDTNTSPTQQSGTGQAAGTTQADKSHGHVAGAAGTDDQSMVGQNDLRFMTKAAQGGLMEVQLAQMAQQKSASEEVKQYAQKLEQDHTKANEELKKIAEERQVNLPTDLGPHQQEMAKFQGLAGEAFDRAYIKMQVKDHKKDISEFRKQADRGIDSDLKAFASAQLPTLEQHLQQAQQLSSSTGTRSRKADTKSTGDMKSAGDGNTSSGSSQAAHEEHGNTTKSK